MKRRARKLLTLMIIQQGAAGRKPNRTQNDVRVLRSRVLLALK